MPSESDWIDTDDGRTFVGKTWDDIWGFSKSVRNNFDSNHRVDVKFYAEKFPFYSEMGIKTKTQKKGWTGIWTKENCDELINGWEILNIKEKWPSDIIGPYFNPNDASYEDFYFDNQVAKELGVVYGEFVG